MRVTRRSLALGLTAAALLASLLACESSNGGMTGRSQTCTTGRGTGTCNGTIGKLSGSVTLEFEDDSMSSRDVIDLAGEFSVGEGRIEVGFTNPEGTKVTVQAAPGQPAQVSGAAQGSFQGFYITVTALEGEASNISYSLEYEAR